MALTCRHCGEGLSETFVDLGTSPLANSYLTKEELLRPESYHPLRVYVCHCCLLVQLPEHATPDDIFSSYLYFSSYSPSWVEHARELTEKMAERLGLGSNSLVVEVASNDGYLLQHLVGKTRVLGVEPAANVALEAERKGVETSIRFFGASAGDDLSQSHGNADLIIGINVFAHVPDVHDFVEGFSRLLDPYGTLVLEFPHLQRLIDESQFDTIYHEHYSYFSLHTAISVLAQHWLEVYDVEELPTHGGSLRLFVGHRGMFQIQGSVDRVFSAENRAGLHSIDGYMCMQAKAEAIKLRLLRLLVDAKQADLEVAGFGAPAKGNTLLNYAGIKPDLLPYTVDDSPHKQGRFLPGSRIPILAPSHLSEDPPDVVLVLPWNLMGPISSRIRTLTTKPKIHPALLP